MKRIWIAIISFTFIVVACMLEMVFINKSISSVQQKLYSTQDSIKTGDYQLTDNLINELQELWDNKNEKLALVISHNYLDTVDQSINVLKANFEVGEYNDFISESYRLNSKLDSLKESDALTLSNII